MPRVESYGQRQVATTPLPGVRRHFAETYESLGGKVGEAQAGLGAQVAGIGVQLFEQERRRAAQIQLRDADQALARWEIERRTDPEKGWLTRRGVDAIGLADQVDEEFRKETGRIRVGLRGQALEAFERTADERRTDLQRWAANHANTEVEKHDAERHASYVQNAVQNGIAHSDDRLRVALERDRVIAETTDWSRRNGRSVDATAAEIARALTVLHRGVITQLNARGQDVSARKYYDRVKDEIDGAARTELEAQLETASTTTNALRTSEALWQQLGPTSDAAPIHLDRMEDAARGQFREDPKALDLTIRYLRDRKAGVDAARRERSEARTGAIYEAVYQGRSLADVSRLPEFVNAPGKLQTEVRDYFRREAEHQENRAYTREQREYTAVLRRERELEVNGWAEYWQLSDPATLRTMSRAQILEKFPTLGREHVTRLLSEQQQLLTTDTAVRSATIDDDLFKEVAFNAGLDYAYNPSGPTQRANLGKLRATVEAEVARRQRGANRVLGLEEKREVLTKLVDGKVMFDRSFWYDDGAVGAAVANAGDQEKAYVPIGEVPPANIREAVNFLRSTTPAFQRLTDEQIRSRAARAIERAYAAKVMRLGPEEELRRLQSR